eukprot:s3856_g6.t1
MGSVLSREPCSMEPQKVRDCCHLEGETPIEIRIAFSQQRPASYPASHEGAPQMKLPPFAPPAVASRGARPAREPKRPRGLSLGENGFDSECFAAPDDDSAHSSGRCFEDPEVLAALTAAWAQEMEYFPEVVRVPRGRKAAATPADESAGLADSMAIAPGDRGGGGAKSSNEEAKAES